MTYISGHKVRSISETTDFHATFEDILVIYYESHITIRLKLGITKV
jgi:hypothetical protein